MNQAQEKRQEAETLFPLNSLSGRDLSMMHPTRTKRSPGNSRYIFLDYVLDMRAHMLFLCHETSLTSSFPLKKLECDPLFSQSANGRRQGHRLRNSCLGIQLSHQGVVTHHWSSPTPHYTCLRKKTSSIRIRKNTTEVHVSSLILIEGERLLAACRREAKACLSSFA